MTRKPIKVKMAPPRDGRDTGAMRTPTDGSHRDHLANGKPLPILLVSGEIKNTTPIMSDPSRATRAPRSPTRVKVPPPEPTASKPLLGRFPQPGCRRYAVLKHYSCLLRRNVSLY